MMSATDDSADSYESDIITYASCGKTYQSAGSVSDRNYDFLDVLGVAQRLRINFLPIRWQPALDEAGKGGTATIRQGQVNLELSFAFKQLKRTQSLIKQAQYMGALIAEISILAHYKVKLHSNIVNLQGICWDVYSGGENVWPVLVFEKAPYGDLEKFMASSDGTQLNFEKRLNILADVALAVRDLHFLHVIHGDIKPNNILIFPKVLDLEKWRPNIARNDIPVDRIVNLPKEEGSYVAKVTDFGYSTLFGADNAAIRMPRSQFWTAPEWHERYFLPIQAKRMDAYSFGMLCLWLFFYDRFSNANCDFEKIMEESNLRMLNHALELTESIECHKIQQRTNIQNLFRLTLAQDPTERTSDFDKILQILSPNRPPNEPIEKISIPHSDFRIDLSPAQLIDAHFQVRNYIVRSLEEKNASDSATPYTKLELALCYHLGFGTSRDPVKSQLLVDECRMGPWIFEAMVESVQKFEISAFEFARTQYGALNADGLIPEFDPSQQYREEGQLHAAESQYRREIKTFEHILGSRNVLVQKLRSQLAYLLEGEGRWKEAENLRLEIISHADAAAIIALVFYTNVARIYWKQGRYTEAENIARRCVEACKIYWGEEHHATQNNNQLLASILRSQHKSREASQIGSKSTRIFRKLRGENHPDTISSMENEALRIPGPHNNRERTLRQTLAMWTSVVGKEHPHTLANMYHLAEVLKDQGKIKASIDMHQQAYDLRKLHLGEEHLDTLDSMSKLAWVVNNEGRYEQAEAIQQRAIQLTGVNLGRKHPEMLKRLVERAHMRIGGNRNDIDKKLDQQMMTEWEINAEHLGLLESIDTLGDELVLKGRYEEAERVYRRVIMMKEKVLGKESFHVTRSMDGLSHLFFIQGRYTEAEVIDRHTLALRESILGSDHDYTGLTACSLANVLLAQKRFGEAEEVARRFPTML